MAIDLSRVAAKALETALEDGQPHRRHSTMRAVAAGAALAVGARAAMSNKTKLLRHLPGLAELRDIPDRVRDRMADAGRLDDEDQEPEAEYEEAPEEDEDLDDEEELEDDEDSDEDDEEEPEAEGDEDFDDEEELEDDEDEPAPELELESEDDEDLHPEDRPPKPPRSEATSGR